MTAAEDVMVIADDDVVETASVSASSEGARGEAASAFDAPAIPVKKTIKKKKSATTSAAGVGAASAHEEAPRAPSTASDDAQDLLGALERDMQVVVEDAGASASAALAPAALRGPASEVKKTLKKKGVKATAASESAAEHASIAATMHQNSGPACDFRIKFTQIVAFKSFFENLGSVLSEVTLEIKNDVNGFRGLLAECMDARGIVLVLGRLAAQVQQLNVEDATFCMVVKNVLDLFCNIHPQHFIDLYRIKGSSDITLFVYEPGCRTTSPNMTIRTLARVNETLELGDMRYDFYVEMDLNTFKNVLKTAKAQKATQIQLCVFEEPLAGSASNASSSCSSEKTVWFVVKYESESTSMTVPFESRILVSQENDSLSIRAITGAADAEVGGFEDWDGPTVHERLAQLQPVYSDVFNAEYLCLFVAKMDRNNITFRLAQGKPLVVEYPLGSSSTDQLRYVLAPSLHGTE